MKYLAIIFLMLLSTEIQAQEEETKINENIYNTAGIQVQPEFPGGMEMFYSYLMKRLDHSKIKSGEKLIVAFTVNELGEMKKIRLVQLKDETTAIEILNALKNFPKWKPAYKLGNPVSVELKIPIVFK